MIEHVSRWLDAYLDGELKGDMANHINSHLAVCDLCRVELEELKQISDVLKVDADERRLLPDTHFSAEVALKLPRHQDHPSQNQITQIGWWLIPSAIMAAWVFLHSVLIVSSLVAASGQVGLITGPFAGLSAFSSQPLEPSILFYLPAGQLDLASRSFLEWLSEWTSFGRSIITPVIFQAALGILFTGWLFAWWFRNSANRSK
jgi:predicted anti-sigma-YlaC factor YlaD